MPTLLIHHAGQTRGAVFHGRVLIGRVAPGGIVIPDPAVSRIHAWIDAVQNRFYVADALSRTGTVVGEYAIAGRHVLDDGDEIHIGPATIQYHEADTLPDTVTPLELAHVNGRPIAAAGGILFACPCGAPLWAPEYLVGQKGRCEQCGSRTAVPPLPRTAGATPPAVARPPQAPVIAPPPTAPVVASATRVCSICQWKIDQGEAETTCPTCHLTFHADCWEQNKGCSAYGCASVNALASEEERAAHYAPPSTELDPSEIEAELAAAEQAVPDERFPMEFALLGGSVVCSLLGLLAFGLPAAVVALGSPVYWLTQRKRGENTKNGLLAAALAISLAGIVAGLWLSAFRWLGRPLATPWRG